MSTPPPPIIQSLWIGEKLSLIEQLCITSFIHNGHEFHLYTYGKVANVPNGTILKNANNIIPEKNIFTYGKGSYAIFADWFRWMLLYDKGNFWVDMDVVCLKPFMFDTNIVYGFESNMRAAIGVLRFPPKHELCKFLAAVCKRPNLILPYDNGKTKLKKITRRILNNKRHNVGWGEAGGPGGFTKALQHFNLLDIAKPYTYFYPVHFSSWRAIFDETLSQDSKLFSDTHAIHLWNEMGRRCKGFDKNASFPKNSLIEQLKTKYL